MTSGNHPVRHSASGRTGYALLRFDRTRLLVPQAEVRVIELTMDLERIAPPPEGVGWIRFLQQRYPVYCVTPDLAHVTTVLDDRPVCTLLEASAGIFGILCSEAKLLKAEEVVLHDIPPAMAAPHLPFRHLAVLATDLACVSSASRLLSHLRTTGLRTEKLLSEAP